MIGGDVDFDPNIYHNILYRSWATGIPRAFDVRYNAYTQSIEVLQHKDQVLNLVKDIRGKCVRLTPRCDTVSYLPPYFSTVTTLSTIIFSICFGWVFLRFAQI